MLRRVLHCLIVALSTACGNDSADPFAQPKLPPPDVQNPRGCGELFDGGSPSDGKVLVGGEAAGCLANEAKCSLGTVDAFSGVCDAGVAYAICALHHWQLACAGLGDAGDAGDADADAANADASGD
jgi:hypothetical protein